MIPQDFIQTVLSRTDIVNVVEPYVPLKRSGANYFGCCPFHDEKSPSFSVSPSKQFYHCFGCGAHGSAISFLMDHRGLTFPEAVQDLASQAGLEVPTQRDTQTRSENTRSTQIVNALGEAALFYHSQLLATPEAMNYLEQRGLDRQTIEQFAIGYAPDDWQSLKAVFNAGYEGALPLDAGLTLRHESGRIYDRFRDRIMFPITDERGALIGFGGRVLGKGEPKYINSPETAVFDKSRELYGLYDARESIRTEGFALVVEGYMDVVALAQFGIQNAVASLGTALTATHAQKLFRYTDRIVFCFDGDAAGLTAAQRALERTLECLTDTRRIEFLFLPDRHDPDSFIRANGIEAFRAQVVKPVSMSQFAVETLQQRFPCDTAEGRARLAHEAKQLLLRLNAPMLRVLLITEIARITHTTPDALMGAYQLPEPTAPKRQTLARTLSPSLKNGALEQLLCHCVNRPALAIRLPVALLDAAKPVAQALLALHDAVSVGDIAEDAAPGIVRECFREHAHFGLFDAALTMIMSEEWLPEDETDAHFLALTASLEGQDLGKTIDRLLAKNKTATLTREERRELNDLLLQQRNTTKGPQAGM